MKGPQEGVASPFVEELERLLSKRRLSWRKLADLAGYHPSWLSKIRNGTPPSAEVARRCDQVLEAGGALIALAGAVGALRPAQLPAAPPRFVGREDELRLALDALASGDDPGAAVTIAIDGPPGAGKTAFALRCAHDAVRPGEGYFPDGELYVDLRGYSPHQHPARPHHVLAEFLVALGVPTDNLPSGLEPRAKLYRSLLATRKILIVLDNAASSEQVEPLLPGSLGCGVLVTSRRRLSGLAMRTNVVRVMLGPMPEEESATLLRMVIGRPRADAEPEAINALAGRCGHLPLALRIAAERVATHPHHPVDGLVEELESEEQRLDGLMTEDSVAVRTVFEWSYRDLSRESAQLFRLLGLHRGPQISADAAAAVAALPPVGARRLLDRLAGVHLLEGVVRDRYRFHDLLRVYAAERADAEESVTRRRAAVRRLVSWYLHTTAAANRTLAPYRMNPLTLPEPEGGIRPLTFSDDQTALRWCDAEASNFEPVIRLAVDFELYGEAWRMAVALWDYLLLRKPGPLWVATHKLARKAAQSAGDRYAEGWVETNLAAGYRWLRRYEPAQELYDHALKIRQEIGDRHGQAWTIAGSGFLAMDQGLPGKARDHAERSLAIFREMGDLQGEAAVLTSLADTHLTWDRYDDAITILKESLAISQKIDDANGQGWALVMLANVHLACGDSQQALDFLNRALHARHVSGDRWGEADALARRAEILRSLDHEAEARESWESALLLYEEVDDPRAADIRGRLEKDSSTVLPGGEPHP